MKITSKKIITLVIAVNICVVAAIFLKRHRNQHTEAVNQLKVAAPHLHDRLSRKISQLDSESPAVSLAKLSDVNMFFWPGPSMGSLVSGEVPLSKEVGETDLEAICSNRRFCKLIEQFASVDDATLTKMVGGEIDRCTEQYLKLYEAELRQFEPRFRIENLKGQTGFTGPTFVTGTVKEDEVVIVGIRLKILTLVALSGARGLTECKTNIDQLTRIAMKQRRDLYDDTTLAPFFRADMLRWASLYNRQILGTALLGVNKAEPDRALIARDLGLTWGERQLASYKAALTEFDLPVRSGVAKPDYSLGSRPMRFLSPMDDAQFDQLVTKCGLKL